MKKKRLGNDIRFNWAIVHNDGDGHVVPYNLEGKNLVLTVMSQIGEMPYGDLEIDTNVISFTIFGKDQRAHGRYIAILSENAGLEGMKTVDITDIVYLVPHTYLEGGEDRCSHLQTEVVDLESELVVGIPGPRGYSIYDYAVKYYHFQGTEKDFWEWFKKAVDDANAAAANAADAQASIEESERQREENFSEMQQDVADMIEDAESLIDVLRTFPVIFVDELPLPSADTMYKYYITPSVENPGTSDMWMSYEEDGVYHWKWVGSTEVDFSQYMRKDDVVVLSEDAYEALPHPDPNKFYATYENEPDV